MNRMSSAGRQSGLTAVIDIGTAKTVCIIAGPRPGRQTPAALPPGQLDLRVHGIGHQQSMGVKAGVIVDLSEAEECIRNVIAQAERMAGVTLETVLLSLSSGRMASHTFTASADTASGHVTARDLGRLSAAARAYVERDGRLLAHLNRRETCLDGTASGSEIVGMAARQISAKLHAVSADEAPVRNLKTVLDRCHLRVSRLVPAPAASALAVTTPDERQLGVTVIDIGSGTSKLASYQGGELVYVRSVPIGSGLVTADIARALHTPLIEAERIKVLYGNVLSARSDEHESFPYPSAVEEEGIVQRETRAHLTSIIRPRTAEILQSVLKKSVLNLPNGVGPNAAAQETLVLTGGGSLLNGMAEFASVLFQRPVRKGQVADVSGLPPVAESPKFATAAGLLFASQDSPADAGFGSEASSEGGAGYAQRVGAWLKNGF